MKAIIRKIIQKWMSLKNNIDEKLGTIEENFHFPASHIFWHILSALAVLGCIVGIVILLWGISPTLKQGVDEAKIVKPDEVTALAVQECANTKKPKTVKRVKKVKTGNQIVETEEEVVVPPPQVSLALLQEVMPNVKFFQKGRKNICEYSEGHYEYDDWGDWVYPSRCYEFGDIDTYRAIAVRKRLQIWFPYDSLTQQNTIDKMATRLKN